MKVDEKELEIGANLGWVLPLNLPYTEYQLLVNTFANSPNALDDKFINYLMDDFQEKIKEPILTNVINVPSYLRSLLNECFDAFEKGHYQICVPALFSVLEGILIDLCNEGDRSVVRYKRGLDEFIRNNKIQLMVFPLISISRFIEISFSKSDFNSIDASMLNRHWSQHGRYLRDLTIKPVLQLFNVISVVLYTRLFLPKKL
ncbi:hypothetical protein ACJZR1_004500 [Vibrio parahaemolyticus]